MTYTHLRSATPLLWPLCLTSLLVLVNCSAPREVTVQDLQGKTVGTVRVQDTENAEYLDEQEHSVGIQRGNVIRDVTHKRIGEVHAEGTRVKILNVDGGEVGLLEGGRDCDDENGNVKGRISQQINVNAAAGACLVYFVF